MRSVAFGTRTYLRNKTQCPDGLRNYWMGHAGKDMSDLYDKIKEDIAFRRKWAERCGFGFQLPSVVPKTTERMVSSFVRSGERIDVAQFLKGLVQMATDDV